MKNKKLLFLVLGTCLLILIIVGGTYAYFNWTSTSENKDAVLTINSVSGDGVCSKATDNNMILKPVSARESGRVVTINTKQRVSTHAFVTWNLTINSINNSNTVTTGLKHKTVRYELVNTTTGVLYASGNFQGVNSGDTFTLSNISETLNYDQNYVFTFYLWIDGEGFDNPADVLGQAYDFDLTCTMTGTPLVQGNYLMVQPYTVNTGSVTSTNVNFVGSTSKTANNVLGKEIDPSLFESITTVASSTVPSNISSDRYWDVSNNQNGSVMAWYTDEDNDNLYELYIGQDGGVIANPDSSHLFSGFRKATSIDVSNLNTNLVTNMRSMFFDCRLLASLNLSNFDTSKVTNMEGMFAQDFSVNPLNISSFDTSNVTNMSAMFKYCYAVTSLDVAAFNTSNVTDMGCMFVYCLKLESLDLSSFNTSNVTNMFTMFHHCEKITSLDLSSFDTSKVTNMSAMFSNCYDLSSVNVTSFDVSGVENFTELFRNCTALTEIDLSSFNSSRVTNMYCMFYGCSNLTTIYVSDLWSNSSVVNGQETFSGCESLVGQNGTAFSSSNTNSNYAVVDTPSTPGYLTYRAYTR